MKLTNFHKENIKEARKMLATIPEKNLDLFLYRSYQFGGSSLEDAPSATSVCCFGGWVAWWPAFRALGVTALHNVIPTIPALGLYNRQVSMHLFGDENLFARKNEHSADKNFSGTDHAYAINRLNWLENQSA